MPRFFDLTDLERLKRERDGDEGLIFACLHYGGFEWIGLALGLSGFKCTVVTQAFKNPLLNSTFNRLREVSGQQTIRREGALLRIYKALREERSVTLAVDLTISAKLPSVPIDCFGMQTCVTFAHAWLHRRAGARIIPTHCEPLPGGRYRLILHPELRYQTGRDEPGNRAGVLGSLRTGAAAKSRTMAVDVQALAVPTVAGHAQVSELRQSITGFPQTPRPNR